jgi:hypothetical protein
MLEDSRRLAEHAKNVIAKASSDLREGMQRFEQQAKFHAEIVKEVRSQHWDERMTVEEKVEHLGLETARALAWGAPCPCNIPGCNLPQEMYDFLKLRGLLRQP